MPESRDRISREDVIVESYTRRRMSRTGNRRFGNGISIAFILEDDNEEGQAAAGTPFRWRDTTMAGSPGSVEVARRVAIGTPRIRPEDMSPAVGSSRGRRGAFVTPRIRRIAPLAGPENLSQVVGSGRRGGGRGHGGSVLPTWYPRRPLNDITAVVRAIERRRERGGDGEGLQTESPLIQDRASHDHVLSMPGAQLERKIATDYPGLKSNRCCTPSIGKVPKILLNITHHNKGNTACLTPQKQLLNSIDTVEKVVMEELRKMKRTPSARKAEREKKVRTLLSMR